MRSHEIDGFRGYEISGQHEIALIFAVFLIHKDNHFARPDFGNYFLNGTDNHVKL
jgi:hypothetical protein